jgi:aryl-alcohol dehydrogenase-like predicted oxidoreductase
MQYRVLGRTNFEVSDIGYGAWGIGGKQWLGGTDDESLLALRRAIDLGVNLIDTALAYGDGHSEQLVGDSVRAAGRKIYVATKVPPKNRAWPAKSGTPVSSVFPYDYLISSAEESLRNLRLETIDLLQLHVWTDEWVERDEWRRAFEDLKRSGKVQSVGVSATEHDPDSALAIMRTGLIDAVQVIYNIFDQTPEARMLPLAREMNIGILARVPLDEGALTGAIGEGTTFPAGDFRAYYFRGAERKRQVVEHVDALRRDLGEGVSLPDTALRFCLSHPAVSSVIPGMRSRRHVESNAALSDLGALSAATLATLKRHAWDRNFYN